MTAPSRAGPAVPVGHFDAAGIKAAARRMLDRSACAPLLLGRSPDCKT
ncbi:hypothetical protein [Streptomyces sp. SAS_260]